MRVSHVSDKGKRSGVFFAGLRRFLSERFFFESDGRVLSVKELIAVSLFFFCRRGESKK